MLSVCVVVVLWVIGVGCGLVLCRGFSYLLDDVMGERLGNYKVRHTRTPLVSASMVFEVPTWRKCLSWIIPIRTKTLKAELRYTFVSGDNQGVFGPYAGIWEDSKSEEINIGGERNSATLQLVDISQRPFRTMGPTPQALPSSFTIDVKLVSLKGQERFHFSTDMTIG